MTCNNITTTLPTCEYNIELTILSGAVATVQWGNIQGLLTNQTDLQDELDLKADKANVLELDNTTSFTPDTDYEPATKKYVDDKAGVISINGEDGVVTLTTEDINEDTDHNYVTDAEKTVIGNTSNTNTGDQASGDFLHNSLGGLNDGSDYEHLTQTEKTNALAGYTHSQITSGDPHNVTKTEIGLSNVPNINCTNASNITTGTLPSSVIPPVALTAVQVAISEVAMLALSTEEGDVVVRSDENKTYMRNSGSAGDMTDFTELQTPTDSVLSVNGKTGTVVLVTGDLSQSADHNYVTDAELAKLIGIEAGAEVNTVDSVNGKTGVVVLTTGDIAEDTDKNYTTDDELDTLAKLKTIQEASQDPTGFDRSDKTTFPIMEFCEDASSGTYRRIDQDALPSTHTGETTFGDGVTPLADRTFIVYPDIHNGRTEYSYFCSADGLKDKFVKTGSETIVLPNTRGKKIVVFDGGVLSLATSVADAIVDKALVSALYCDGQGVYGAFGHEVHGKEWSSIMHLNAHQTIGTLYESGLDIKGLEDGSGIYTKIEEGLAWDEDIDIQFREKTTQPFIHKNGADGHFVWSTANDKVASMNGSVAQYNYYNTDTSNWELKDLTGGQFTLTMFYGTNDAFEQIVKIIGQDVYENLAEALRDIPNAVNSVNAGDLMMPEFVPLYTVIVRANGELIRIDDDRLFRDERSPRGHIPTTDAKADGFLYSLSNAKQDISVVVDTGKVYLEVEKDGGGNYTYNLNGTDYVLDCTTGSGTGGKARIELPQGTATEMRKTYVYVATDENIESISLMTATTKPEGIYSPVAIVGIQTHAEVTSNGPLLLKETVNAVDHDGRGAIAYLNERIRALGATYSNGVDQSMTITTNSSALDDVNFTVTSGDIYGLHREEFSHLDIATAGIYVANAEGSGTLDNNDKITNIGLLKEDAEGTAIANNEIGIFTIWGSSNSKGESKLFVNLPTNFYTSEADAKIDANKYAVTTIPTEYKETGFLIAQVILKYTTADSGTWDNVLSESVQVWKSDAANWATENFHKTYPNNNYPNGEDDRTSFTKTGAIQIRAHMSHHNTESNYDFLAFNAVNSFPTSSAGHRSNARSTSGNIGPWTGPLVPGNTLHVQFFSDGFVQKPGCKIDRIDYLVEIATGGEFIDLRGISSTGGGTSTSGGVITHNDLAGRDAADSHPISSITDLQTELDGKLETVTTDDVELNTIGTPTHTNMQDLLDTVQSAGKISGGEFTDNADGTITVSAGTGLIKSGVDANSPALSFDWAEDTSVTLADKELSYIYIDYNSGSPIVKSQIGNTGLNNRNKIRLGKAYREGTTVHFIAAGLLLAENPKIVLQRFIGVDGDIVRADGIIVGETGTRNISVTEGNLFAGLTPKTTPAIDTSGTDDFNYFYRDGSGGWTEVNTQTQISNTQYDDGSGTLANLTPTRYGVHWGYVLADGTVEVLYGQGDYNKLSEAESAVPPTTIPEVISKMGFLAARIIIVQNATTFTSISSSFEQEFTPTPISEHNDLAGIQGGTAGEYNHLTNAEVAKLTGIEVGAEVNVGEEFTSTEKTKLNGIETNADVTDIANVTSAGAEMTANKDTASGYAGLDASSKINPSQLPAIAISETSVVASEAAQLALTVQEGDVAVRTDEDRSYIALNSTNATMSDWQELLSPSGGVSSVFGRSGTVTAQNNDYDAGQIAETATKKILTDTERTKLAGIETNADVTDTANVTSAGALMDSEVDADIKTLTIAASTSISGINTGDDPGLENVVEDTTPQLGGALDVNGKEIVSVSNGDIPINPDGTGKVITDKSLGLLNTTHADEVGIIYKGTTPFIHNFNYGDNGTVTTTGNNTFIGLNAGNLTMGSTATNTLHSSTNVAIGQAALTSNTIGYSNMANGCQSLYSNTTGAANTASGYTALRTNTSGSGNTAIGNMSMYYNTTGSYNSAIGYQALNENTTGRYNIANGYRAGSYTTAMADNNDGDNNVFIGADTKSLTASDTNEIVIGHNTTGIGSNSVIIGNSAVTKTELRGGIINGSLSSDPADPADGKTVQWVSDGTGSGDAGDVLMKLTVGATTKTITLVDFSAI